MAHGRTPLSLGWSHMGAPSPGCVPPTPGLCSETCRGEEDSLMAERVASVEQEVAKEDSANPRTELQFQPHN